MRKLELLAPAKNLQIGIAAIEHGADAVYIGADGFGARQAAGNSVEDIRQLCEYAHRFDAKVYVTVNTIVYDQEWAAVKELMARLASIHVDGILIQDMGLLELKNQTGLPFHASTQCDVRSVEKVRWLKSLGFQRAVLARELSLTEIRKIHEAVPDIQLEVFVHGALCVSYSGVCYASQKAFGRSANRGNCAQFCRLKFDLVDSEGTVIEKQRYMLSLKDLCLASHLEELADAGASSFKIEGRLKDADYVKNVVSAYSRELDQLVKRRPEDYCRSSRGRVAWSFQPDLQKTFNRGFTTYFLNGRQEGISAMDTPKVTGEYVGVVKEVHRGSFSVAGTTSFVNGDGLCFFNEGHELEGFRVNRVENNWLFPQRMPAGLRKGIRLYRNHDEAFRKILEGQTAERKIPLQLKLSVTDRGARLEATDDRCSVETTLEMTFEKARNNQRENMNRQLTKLGNTSYTCQQVAFAEGTTDYFVPNSLLSTLKRKVIDELETASKAGRTQSRAVQTAVPVPDKSSTESPAFNWQPEYGHFPYLYNISNRHARDFYSRQGLKADGTAFELRNLSTQSVSQPLIMQCRYCIRYALGFCVKRGGKRPTWKEPLSLVLPDGRKFKLEFNCRVCQMNIYAEN
ncbi:U32 family peptidase [Prevotella cerevisiae]|uniref:U32 family peptidase n=1 Tax=Segatella cerevisiae TaxID=2053716 RepID=A0ABT1BUG6_9BACT|nr:U32 family peptidase [Segatella cerevisiae]MCO6024728.1 U32 family peptidase [Segatella cerevisiae]